MLVCPVFFLDFYSQRSRSRVKIRLRLKGSLHFVRQTRIVKAATGHTRVLAVEIIDTNHRTTMNSTLSSIQEATAGHSGSIFDNSLQPWPTLRLFCESVGLKALIEMTREKSTTQVAYFRVQPCRSDVDIAAGSTAEMDDGGFENDASLPPAYSQLVDRLG